MSAIDLFDMALELQRAHPQWVPLDALCRQLRTSRATLLPAISLLAYEGRVVVGYDGVTAARVRFAPGQANGGGAA